MEHSFHSSQWTWKEFDIENEEETAIVAKKHHTCKKWVEDVRGNKTNSLRIHTETPGEEIMWGSIVYAQHPDEKKQRDVFHFYLTRNEMITANFHLFKFKSVNEKAMKEKMHHSETPIEGFFVLIGEIMIRFLMEIDKFEEKLRNLLWEMKEQNNTKTLDRMANADHELLVWKNLIIPMSEIQMAAEEVFGDEVMEGPRFKQTKRRIERARFLIQNYEEEIEALISLENVVSSHRGNEIVKTLTVITTLFTPVMALGAIWGMNFKHMPELEWKYGYLFSGVLIGLCTFAIFAFLKKKGWMGDILSVSSKKSFFK